MWADPTILPMPDVGRVVRHPWLVARPALD